MSNPFAVVPAQAQSGVRAAIAHAAGKTGVDFDYLMTKARLESSLDPHARAHTSSASGLYQFIGSTWLETLDRHGGAHGLGWAQDAIGTVRGRAVVHDPAARAAIMDLRFDPNASALMAAELARDNAAGLQAALGRAPDGPELYLAHFLGLDGASRFLTALEKDPAQPAAHLFPKPAAANSAIFNNRDGSPRSLDGVMALMRSKYEQARLDLPSAPASAFSPMPGAAMSGRQTAMPGGPAPAMPPAAPGGTTPPRGRPSMSEVLRTTFLANSDKPGAAASGERVRQAYDRLRSSGL